MKRKKSYPSKNPYSYLTEERKADMRRYLHNNEVISVFCDCSVNMEKTQAGLAFCMVGDSQFTLRSKTCPLGNNVQGEIKALSFALETIPKLLDRYRNLLRRPKKVRIYTDYNQLELLLNGAGDKEMRNIVDDLLNQRDIFINSTFFNLDLLYLEEERKSNLYYKAAHNAARKAIKLH